MGRYSNLLSTQPREGGRLWRDLEKRRLNVGPRKEYSGPGGKTPTWNQVGDYVQENPLDAAALATSPIPLLGDAVGLAADASSLYENPSWAGAGLAVLGALPFIPGGLAGTIKKGKTESGLPMDAESRLARAEEMGFRTGMPLYHGTTSPKDFEAFARPQGDINSSYPGASQYR